MIIKKEYKGNHAIKYTLIDNIEKIDVNNDQELTYINVYKNNRKNQDDFETINVIAMNVYICNDTGKTLAIYRG